MKTHFNLLPFTLQRSRQRSRWLRRAVLLWGTTLLCCGSYGLIQNGRLEQVRASANSLDRECTAVRTAAKKNRAMQDEIAALQRRLDHWKQLEQADLPLSVVGLVGTATQRHIAQLQLDRLRIEDLGTPSSPSSSSSPAAPRTGPGPAAGSPDVDAVSTRIELSGTAVTDAAVGDYVNTLRSMELFSVVELVSTQGVQVDTGQAREFRIRCAF